MRFPKVGRRGATHLAFAVIFGVYAFAFLAHPELIKNNPNRDLVNRIATPLEWGLIFAAVAAFKIVASAWQRLQPAAFGVGTAVWATWGIAYWVEWLQGDGVYPYLTATIYTALATINLIIAGWPESREMR